MTFEIASMFWSQKEATVIHKRYSTSKALPWTADPCKCLHDGDEHNLPADAWKFISYTPLPIGSAAPKKMSAVLQLDVKELSDDELKEIEQHFVDKRQLSLTVYFNDLRPATLLVNLFMD